MAQSDLDEKRALSLRARRLADSLTQGDDRQRLLRLAEELELEVTETEQ